MKLMSGMNVFIIEWVLFIFQIGDFLVQVISDGYLIVSLDLFFYIDLVEVVQLQLKVGVSDFFLIYINIYLVWGKGCMIFIDVGVGGGKGWGGELKGNLL